MKFTLTSIFLLVAFASQAVVNAPRIERICLNNADSVATLEWTDLVDACGSFTEYHIYGRKNTDPFTMMGVETSGTATSYQIKLPDTDPSWEFYLEVLHTCDGSDSVSSASLRVDAQKPALLEIDSVSVDLATQRIIIGWPQNPAPDTKGYRVYSYSNAVNTPIGDTAENSYVLVNQNVTSPIRLTMATFDSCDLFSPVSGPHSIVILSANLDTCAREISLNWSAYRGWPVEEYGIYTSTNGGAFQRIDITTNQTYVYSNYTLGDDVSFFIRAYKQGENVTSSSNRIDISSSAPVAPNLLYLSNVTISGDDIEVRWLDDFSSDLDSFALYKNGTFITGTFRAPGLTEHSYLDNNVSVNSQRYTYTVIGYDRCRDELARSNQGENILLLEEESSLTWNPYMTWAGNLDYQELWYSDDSSTWNYHSTLADAETDFDLTDEPAGRCYRIHNFETNNPFIGNKESISNTVCKTGSLVFYFPNALNPSSKNNQLKIVGVNIDYQRSNIQVYNRWGQIIYDSNDLTKGWDATFGGELVPTGIYIYRADIWGTRGERETVTGDIRVIR